MPMTQLKVRFILLAPTRERVETWAREQRVRMQEIYYVDSVEACQGVRYPGAKVVKLLGWEFNYRNYLPKEVELLVSRIVSPA